MEQELSLSSSSLLKIQNTIEHHQFIESALTEIFFIAREEWKYFTIPKIEYLSNLLKLPSDELMVFLSGLSNSTFKNSARNEIYVCKNLACLFKGAEQILDFLNTEFNLNEEGSSPDNRFKVQVKYCLGQCDKAPCIQVNNKVEHVTDLREVAFLLEENP